MKLLQRPAVSLFRAEEVSPEFMTSRRALLKMGALVALRSPRRRDARTREVAKQQGVEVFISNHNGYDGAVDKLAAKTDDGPNPFVLGAPTVQRALTVMNECAQATLALWKS